MKKVMFYISSMGKGGAERVLSYLLSYLKDRYEIILVTDRRQEQEYGIPDGVQRINIGDYPGKGPFAPFLRKFWRQRQIKKIYNRVLPDTAVGFMGKNAVRLLLAVGRRKGTFLAAIRMNPVHEFGEGSYKSFVCRILNRADRIVCQTTGQKQYFPKRLWSRTIVIKNPIGEEFCSAPPAHTGKQQVVAVGRLDENKNHKMLIRAFDSLHRRYPEAGLTIYGDGECRKQLEELIAELGLDDCVSLPGLTSKIREAVRDARIYVLCSDSEGIPNSLLEAMAIGKAVVSTDCEGGAAAELIEDGKNGFLVPVGDTERLAEKLLELWEQEELLQRAGTEASKVRELYRIEKICSQWEAVL